MHEEFVELYKEWFLFNLKYQRGLDRAFQEMMYNDPWIAPEVEQEGPYTWNII